MQTKSNLRCYKNPLGTAHKIVHIYITQYNSTETVLPISPLNLLTDITEQMWPIGG